MGGTNVWDAEWEVNEEQARTLIGRQFPQLSYIAANLQRT